MQLNSTLLSALHCLLKVGQRPGGRACESVSPRSSHKCHLLQIANTNCHLRSPTQPTSSKKSKIRFHELGGMIPTVTFYSPPPPLYSHKWHGVIWHPAESNCHIGCSCPHHWPLRHLSSPSMLICSKQYVCNRCTFSAFSSSNSKSYFVTVELGWSTRKWEK